MPTTIHLVRHAQGEHNLSTENQQIRDPSLTELGRTQCAELRRAFPVPDRITHIVASPMRRTLYTALLGFAQPAVEGDGENTQERRRVVALPSVQEVSVLPCDCGSDPAALKAEFAADAVDLALVHDGWNHKGPGSPYAPEIAKLDARAREARRWLRDLGRASGPEDVHVVVVTHGGFLHFLTEDWGGVILNRGERAAPLNAGGEATILIGLLRHGLGEHRVPVVRICRSGWS